MFRAGAALAVVLILVGACGSPGEEIEVSGSTALTWGDGPYGVVLAHGRSYDAASWEDQAVEIADQGATVIAVEDISPEIIAAAVAQLNKDGIEDVALVGGSAGADAILDLSATQPDLADQLILLSPNSAVAGLGDQPKLFIASEDEPVAEVSRGLANSAPGQHNDVVMLPGSAHAQGIFESEHAERALTLILDRLAQHGSPEGERVQVRQVIDGDTVELADGRDVRLIGIDTPEREECGYEQARSLLTRLLTARGVTVTVVEAPGQDLDRYDRLLRYVEADGVDVADALLDGGWAEARYDSREGYPEHPREEDYRTADARSLDRGC